MLKVLDAQQGLSQKPHMVLYVIDSLGCTALTLSYNENVILRYGDVKRPELIVLDPSCWRR